jgi:nucleoside-diphosphate-sugar epimerase
LLGGNGQVAAEIALYLARQPGIHVRPVVRTRGGSAFLRLNGVTVWHGDVSHPDDAQAMLEGADVVANFALASGTPRESLARNRVIIERSISAAPPGATIVFCSTLAVHGEYDLEGRRRRSFYGDMKRANERQVRTLARRAKRPAYILRLGHVIGAHQNLARVIHSEIADPPVRLPFPDRPSNVVATATIADALIAIAENRAGTPGTYDLVNVPNWTWQEVYAHEARQIGKPLELSPTPGCMHQEWGPLSLIIAGMVGGTQIRELALKALSWLPASAAASAKANYAVARARREIAELAATRSVTNNALFWPGLRVKHLPGLRETGYLLDTQPRDLASALFDDFMTSWREDADLGSKLSAAQ